MTIYQCKKCDFTTENKSKLGSHTFLTHCEDNRSNVKSAATCAAMKAKRIEEYLKNPKYCLECNFIIPYEKKVNKFCSSSCCATRNNRIRLESGWKQTKHQKTLARSRRGIKNPSKRKNPIRNPKIQTVSYISFCVVCGKCIQTKNRKTCSDQCLNTRMSEHGKENAKHMRSRWGRRKKSYLELSFANWLNDNKIEYLSEHSLKNYDKNSTYWADFYFPERNLIIELDGNQHDKTIVEDSYRDNYISKTYGLKIIRIKHSEYIKKTRLTEIESVLGLR